MGPVVEPLRIPGTERTNLVDDPAIVTSRFGARDSGLGARDSGFERMPESFGFTNAFAEEQADIIEQKPAAILERHLARRAAGRQISRLRQNPGIPQHTSTDEHAFDA